MRTTTGKNTARQYIRVTAKVFTPGALGAKKGLVASAEGVGRGWGGPGKEF